MLFNTFAEMTWSLKVKYENINNIFKKISLPKELARLKRHKCLNMQFDNKVSV